MIARIATTLGVPALLLLAAVGCGGTSAPAPKPEADTPAHVGLLSPVVESMPATQPTEEPVFSRLGEALPEVVRKTFPLAASVTRVSEPFPHQVIRDSAGLVVGYEVFSDSAGTTALGYAGMVPLQVFFDGQGRPERIHVLEHHETQAYMELIYRSGLLEKLLGFDPAEPESLDAVTLATSSSRAIIVGVTGLAARVSAELAGPNRGSR